MGSRGGTPAALNQETDTASQFARLVMCSRVDTCTIAAIMTRHALRWSTAAIAAILGCSTPALADTLASAVLVTPLAPEQKANLSIPMPRQFAADQDVWIGYEMVALSPTDNDDGEVGIEQSFEGVMTPATSLFATFHAGKMDSRASAGTIAQRLDEIAGHREPAELKLLMGEELYAAYEGVNSGKGRMLAGRQLRRLPAPGRSDAPLLISVTRAAGMQPLAVKVTVGQGDLSPEFQQKPQDSLAWKFGYGLGILLFGWLVMRFFRRRSD